MNRLTVPCEPPCPSRFARRFANTSRAGASTWKVILFVAGLVTTSLALSLRPLLRTQWANQTEKRIHAVEAALEHGNISQALELAQSAVKKGQRTQRSLGECLTLLGLVREQQGERATGADRMVYYSAACQHFTEAAKARVGPELRAKLNFHLAKCLVAGNQFSESIPLLRKSLTNYPEGRTDALQLLSLVYLSPGQFNLELARRSNSELLCSPGLSPEKIGQAWQTRTKIVQQLGKQDLLAGVEVASSRIGSKWVSLLVGALESYEEKQFDEAIAGYQKLVEMRGLPHLAERRIWYLMGLSAHEKGDDETTLSTFRTVEWRYPNTEEAACAAAHAGAILLRQGKTAQAIAAMNRAMNLSSTSDDSPLGLMDRNSLVQMIAATIDRLRDQDQYEAATELMDTYRQIAPGSTADRVAAQLHESWANAIAHAAESQAALDAQKSRYRAAELYRVAGTFRTRVADAAASTQETASLLWQAAQDFVQGEGYLAAVNALDRLLATGTSGDLRANALALTCAALEASGRTDQVAQVAKQCVQEFPNHPATVKALYHQAKCQIACGALEPAEASLCAILRIATSETDPMITQKSRLFLAHLLTDQGRDEEAIPRIHEILVGPSDAEVSQEARLLLSDSLRRRARRPAGRMTEAHRDEAKAHYRQRKSVDLEQAMNLLTALERELAALERTNQLTVIQSNWLHECRWGIAECLYDSERYEEAIGLYQALAQTYSETSDWLESQIQIANCQLRMNRTEAARAVLRAARARLEQMPTEAVEQTRIGMSPGRWKEWIDWLHQL